MPASSRELDPLFLEKYRKNPSILSAVEADLVLKVYEQDPRAIQFANDAVVLELVRRNKIGPEHLLESQEDMLFEAMEKTKLKRTEICATLGLEDKAGNGGNGWSPWWTQQMAAPSTCTRYQQSSKDRRPLPYQELPGKPDNFFSDIIDSTEHGGYRGYAAGWDKHSFSVQAIRDGNTVHFIYVNRGQKAFEKTAGVQGTVIAFSCPAHEAGAFSKRFHAALITRKQETISTFLAAEINSPLYNKTLSSELTKSNQKTGNCSVANANISWHLNLVSQAMKASPELGFPEAYHQTQSKYKALRTTDRCHAFCQFMCVKDQPPVTSPDLSTRLLSEIMRKFHLKDLENNQQTVQKAVTQLAHESPELLLDLYAEIKKIRSIEEPTTVDINKHWEEETRMALIKLVEKNPGLKVPEQHADLFKEITGSHDMIHRGEVDRAECPLSSLPNSNTCTVKQDPLIERYSQIAGSENKDKASQKGVDKDDSAEEKTIKVPHR